MQRRGFLRRGLVGGALLAVAGGGVIALRPGDRSLAPSEPMRALSPAAYPVLVAVAARVLAGTTASPTTIARRVDSALRAAAPEVRKDLDTALALLENALTGLVLRGRPTPFTLLDERAQDAALLGWRDSRLVLLRSAYNGLRKLCLAAHYATPDGWPDTGYPGPTISKPAPPPITARGALAVASAEPAPVEDAAHAPPPEATP